MKKALLFIFLCATFFGCSPQQRLSRLLKKYPDLIKSDTINAYDTVYAPPVVRDSVFYFYQRDTVVIREKGAVLKYYTHSDSTVYVQVRCDSVKTVTRHRTITRKVEVEKPLPVWVWVLTGAFVLLFILTLRRRR